MRSLWGICENQKMCLTEGARFWREGIQLGKFFKKIRIVQIRYFLPKVGLTPSVTNHPDIFEACRQIWMAKGRQTNCSLMKRTG